MAKRILLALSHSIEEHDQLKLLSGLGYEVASLGGYIDPAAPHDTKRPALPVVPRVGTVKDAVDALGTDDNIGAAQSRIPDGVLEWLGHDGVIIFHHRLERLFGQWGHLVDWRNAGGRVIWRTVGQSTEQNERDAASFRADGLEVVRYSPRERHIPGYVGQDALIRFYKDPEEWRGWRGNARNAAPFITNVTQHLLDRAVWCNAEFYQRATDDLPCRPAGPGSEALPGGQGQLSEAAMRGLLRDARAYLYTGTQPASYTLGLLEALFTGVPVVSIGPSWMKIFPYGSELFEGHELAPLAADEPAQAHKILQRLLEDEQLARKVSAAQLATLDDFKLETVEQRWLEYLGAP